MKNEIVRLKSIEINNFKNVKYGVINFENNRKNFKSSILGLYGQNGSGKTALIDALELLKYALSGKAIPAYFADFINIDEISALLKYNFFLSDHTKNCEYDVYYEFSLRKDIDESEQNISSDIFNVKFKTTIFNEKLSYSYSDDNMQFKVQPIVDTCTEDVFIPKTKYEVLIGKDIKDKTNLLSAKKIAEISSRSFIFSKELLNTLRQNCKEKYHLSLFENMIFYGNYELFVIKTNNSGLITLDALPIVFRYSENNKVTSGNIMLPLNKSTLIPQQTSEFVKKIVDSMNIVLKEIIPGLTISVRELGNEIAPNGETVTKIQLLSHKNSKEIPLQYESEGIKKIISILQLLVGVYNRASITVAVDELDSGVFEYLLGELLRIISEKGKGQLIFTSHNLRPLETLDRGFVAFTTTNPSKRYMRFTNVQTNNNLRDFYYRDIMLGEQSEPVYELTNNAEIALAFKEAGEISGS